MFFRSYFFFFKQKTAYEMRISDWSSDVCSSDLQQTRLEGLLVSSGGSRNSPLDRLRTGPKVASSRSMSLTLMRLQAVRELGIRLPAATRIPATRVAALARFAGAAKANAILRLPALRRLATLVAFVHRSEEHTS